MGIKVMNVPKVPNMEKKILVPMKTIYANSDTFL